MDWSVVYLLFLIGMVVETAREAYGISWASRHFTRMTSFTHSYRPPRDFWTERRSRREKRIHQKRWHIDLLARSKSGNRKKV